MTERFVVQLVNAGRLGGYLNGYVLFDRKFDRGNPYAKIYWCRPRDARLVGIYQEEHRVPEFLSFGGSEKSFAYRVVWERIT